MSRREFPAKVRVAAWSRSGGQCEACTRYLLAGDVHYDHVIPDALGGEPTLANCEVLCTACHRLKTTGQDVPRIAKAKRQEAKHIGAKLPKQQIHSRGFPRTRIRAPKPALPPRPIYSEQTS